MSSPMRCACGGSLLNRRIVVLTVFLLAATTPSGVAQSPLPLLEDLEAAPLRRRCEVLLSALGAENYPALARLARLKDPLPADFGEAVQKALDPHCLIGVTINPESRVKAARGPR